MMNFHTWLEDWQDPRTLVSILSACISVTSLYFTRQFWLATNRPIICASIITETSGNVGTTYNLVMYNAGNRPATNIRINAAQKALDAVVNKTAKEGLQSMIYKCFSDKIVIPLLINGKESSTGFGMTSSILEDNVLNYGSKIPVVMTYCDLGNRTYTSHQVLIVKDSRAFSDQFWNKKLNQ